MLRLGIFEGRDSPIRRSAAEQFWQELTGAHPGQFRKATLKHHNPATVRKNTGMAYRGCLRIDVRRSRDLYRRIEGWAAAVMTA
jgi:hypothetical protein